MKHLNHSPRLLAAIDELLTDHPKGITEYDLMVLLDQKKGALFPKPDLSDKALLFQHHFMLRHCLYLLQQSYAQGGKYYLEISLTKLTKRPVVVATSQQLKEYDPLREYYLDLSNMNKESAASIEALLESFWKRLTHTIAAPNAHQILGLTGDETFQEKQQQYRKLVQQNHPDKGGDSATFHDIQTAWEQINKRKS